MNDETPSEPRSPGRGVKNRYAQLELEADTIVIYDCEQTSAWIQSDVTVPVGVTAPPNAESESERLRERRLAATHAERPTDGSDIDD